MPPSRSATPPRVLEMRRWRVADLAGGDWRDDAGERVWTSPVVEVAGPFAELVPSWTARTPAGAWLRVQARVAPSADPDDDWSGWFELGHWASWAHPGWPGVPGTGRTSVPGQRSARGSVEVDTLACPAVPAARAWQMRVRLRGDALLTSATAVASASGQWAGPSAPGAGRGTVLDVPALSQQTHRGHFPQWDGGGASWCAAASLAMVLRHWQTGPTGADLAWVGHEDAQVDHAARGTFDAAYGGCGNWAFGVAYAGTFGLDAYVTRLGSLVEAEAFLAAGIPLIASVRHGEGELTGAGYVTDGHLLVVRGVTDGGDVVCNDPASHGTPDNGQVRVTYDRAQFERAWQVGSGGVVYVVAPHDRVPVPPGPTA